MDKKFISKSSIHIQAPSSGVWEALINTEIAKQYFFGAEVTTDWKVGTPITFKGEFNGNKYEEKGVILNVSPFRRLQYSHWSNFDGLPDTADNYRTWTFDIESNGHFSQLTVTEDNIPTEKQKNRSDEFWDETLLKIKRIVEK